MNGIFLLWSACNTQVTSGFTGNLEPLLRVLAVSPLNGLFRIAYRMVWYENSQNCIDLVQFP